MVKSVKKYVIVLVVGAVAAGLLAVSALPDQFADAGSRKKIHFTETFTSAQDPGLGHESHQMVMVLWPNEGTIYDGSMTFVSSSPVQTTILHEINPGDSKGQAIWTVDGETTYGFSLVGQASKAGSVEFTGAALGLHSKESKEFTATVSVDGWTRGQPTEIILQTLELKKEEPPSISLYKANVPVTIPMRSGMYDGEAVSYIMTDASDEEFAEEISERQGWRVEVAPPIADVPESTLQEIFIFTNGVEGDGLYGYQDEVFSSNPEESEYSALNSVTKATWKKGQKETVLESAHEVLEAEKAGRIELEKKGTVANAPHIVWPGGQMTVRENAEISDETQYDGGQITEIDQEEMTVTFVAHRGWGPDGKTVYHIIVDATPSGPAEVMGVTDSATLAELFTSNATGDLIQFQNGIKGAGQLGFQPGIADTTTGDESYSPMWQIYIAEWSHLETAKILVTEQDVDSAKGICF